MYHTLFTIAACLLMHSVQATVPLRYDQIAPTYLATYPLYEKDHRDTENKEETKAPELSIRELSSIGLKVLARDESITKKHQNHEEISSPEVWQNLELFANEHQNPEKTVVGCISDTQTILGRLTLAKMLTEPTTDRALLMQRQDLLRALIADEKLCSQLEKCIHSFATHESNLLALTRENDPLRQDDIYNSWYKGALFGSAPGTLAAEKFIDDSFTTVFDTIGVIGGFFGGYTLCRNYRQKMDECENSQQKILRVAGPILAIVLPLLLHQLGKSRRRSFIYLKKRLRAGHYFIQALEQVKQTLNTETFQLLHKQLSQLDIPANDEVDALKKHLKSSSLTSNRYWFATAKPTFSAFPLIRDHIDELLHGASLIGILDAFVSMARLMQRHRPLSVSYQFVEYLESTTPVIQAVDFWHPCIDPSKAITNSVLLGNQGQPSNLVITGANAGGKSTTMKALALCLLLGQTFGIAPAQRFSFTPFSRINTYLNITDDIGADRSLFKAELYRARTLLEQVGNLAPHEFGFTLLDEVFTGTEPIEGQAGAYGVARALAESPQNITLLATHFTHLTELEADTNGSYKNMKVTVDINADGSLSYPYKLVSGISNQQIALTILEREGFDSLILDKAQHVLANPAAYTPTNADV